MPSYRFSHVVIIMKIYLCTHRGAFAVRSEKFYYSWNNIAVRARSKGIAKEETAAVYQVGSRQRRYTCLRWSDKTPVKLENICLSIIMAWRTRRLPFAGLNANQVCFRA